MPFVPGTTLAADFYRAAVAPALDRPHGAALLGPGSDVLGYDTERSTDHGWGPRVIVFVADEDRAAVADRLAERLPAGFRGYPIGRGTDAMLAPTAGVARDGVTVAAAVPWFRGALGVDPSRALAATDWLAVPTQLLAEVTAGAVFADGRGELGPIRARLAWYPDDVWRYVLACQWARIGEEEAFVGRTGEVGDELGSAVLAARLARDLMRLWLLMHRTWPPYAKWLGTAFAAASGVDDLRATLTRAVHARTWRVREEHLCRAYTLAARQQNALGLAAPVDPATRGYFDRPFQVLDAGRLAAALRASITDPALRERPLVGAVDQFVDSTAVLSDPDRARAALTGTDGSH